MQCLQSIAVVFATLYCLFNGVAIAQVPEPSKSEGDPPSPRNKVTLWGGVMTDNPLGQILIFQDINIRDSGLVGIGFNRTLAGDRPLRIEGEVQAFQHFGEQDHTELTGSFVLRFSPTSRFSVAVIEGVSYATSLPTIEVDKNDRQAHLLNYLSFEAEYIPAANWAIVGRIHHRSGVKGLFSGVKQGSNAYLFGVRYQF